MVGARGPEGTTREYTGSLSHVVVLNLAAESRFHRKPTTKRNLSLMFAPVSVDHWICGPQNSCVLVPHKGLQQSFQNCRTTDLLVKSLSSIVWPNPKLEIQTTSKLYHHRLINSPGKQSLLTGVITGFVYEVPDSELLMDLLGCV